MKERRGCPAWSSVGKPSCALRGRSAPAGVVMVAVLVCVGLVGLITLAILRQVATRRAEVDLAGRTLQARWLAEAALDRAAARLAADPAYRGERWQLSADVLGAAEGGVVQIEVQQASGPGHYRRLRVQADYPDDPLYHVRVTKETELEIPAEPSAQR